MKTIKIRAWARDGEWEADGERQEFVMIDAEDLCFEEFAPVVDMFEDREDNIYFMLFSGLFDKHNKEIYEGDIVEVENGAQSVITECRFETGQFILYQPIGGGYWTRQLYHHPERIQVIGNIYASPELLKK